MTDTPAAMQSNQMVLLGTGTSTGVPVIGCKCPICQSTDPHNQRTRSGVAVLTPSGNFLIDTPPEIRIQLLREKIDLIHAAIYTHAHADHIFGLDDLRIFGYRLDMSIPLYCEPEVEKRLKKSFDYAFDKNGGSKHHFAVPKLHFESVSLEAFELLGLPVQPIRLMHGELPVLGYRINDVAFCTDANYIPDESWPLLADLDVLVINALRSKPHPTHFCIDEALAVIKRLKPKQAYLTHISHQIDHATTNEHLPAGVKLAYDGLRFPL